ncbi:MAG TPA: hypothetical protein VF875_05355 [Anaeromyxobacter sp.]
MEPGRTYRTRRSLRIAVALAALFWAGMMLAVLRLPGGRALPAAGAAGFAVFFVWSYLLYARTWISVGPRGIVSSTLLARRPVAFEDILEIVVRDGLGGRVVAVFTRRGLVHFTSLLERHRELLETLLERTDLVPRRA